MEDKERDMMVDENLIEKTAVVVWEQYIKICKQGFVLDDEVDWSLLENEFEQIKELDPEAKAYACTYSIEYNDNRMYMYCDNLWLKTKLTTNQVAEVFSKYRQIEPYNISELTDDEKETVDVFIDKDFHYCDFTAAKNEFAEQNIISMYWD